VLGRTPHLGYAGSPGPRDVVASRSALGRLDAAHLADRRLGSLSGGERQRAVLARAVAQDARLLLLDEPTSALDVGAQQQVLELVATLRADRGLTVLSAMHDLTHAGQYADRLLLMDGGREVASGRAHEVLTEELVARHYGASVRIVADAETGIAVIPLRPSVHVEETVS
jgi:cobalamin transport system ATP-binding protein